MDIIASRLQGDLGGEVTWQGCKFRFTGATLDYVDFGGVFLEEWTVLDFDEASLTGHVSFDDAYFASCVLSFRKTFIHTDMEFTNVVLRNCEVWFEKATLMGSYVDFTDAEIINTELDLRGVSLEEKQGHGGSQMVLILAKSMDRVPQIDHDEAGNLPNGITVPKNIWNLLMLQASDKPAHVDTAES